MNRKVVFRLAKYYPPRTMKPSDMADPRTLYDRIKDGTKTSEWRASCRYWLTRLINNVSETQVEKMTRAGFQDSRPEDLTSFLKVSKAWFIEGFRKGNIPRLETNVIGLFYHPNTCQLEIKIAGPMEVTT